MSSRSPRVAIQASKIVGLGDGEGVAAFFEKENRGDLDVGGGEGLHGER